MRKILIDRSAVLGAELIRYGECDSTNTRAREYAKSELKKAENSPQASAPKNAIFLADRQSAGRGRRGRSFLSEDGGIYISFLFFAPGEALDIAAITAEAATLAARAIEKSVPLEIDIKWVNDLLVSDKKIAGILTEGAFDENGNLRYYVVGMGINVYKIAGFEAKMPTAACLEELVDCDIDISKICLDLIGEMMGKRPPREELIEEYRRRCATVGRQITVKRADEEYDATAIRINDDYSLSVKLPSGEIRSLNSGEVSSRLS